MLQAPLVDACAECAIALGRNAAGEPSNYDVCQICQVSYCFRCIKIHWSVRRHPQLGAPQPGAQAPAPDQHADTDPLPLLNRRLADPLLCPLKMRKSPGFKRRVTTLPGNPDMVFSAFFQPIAIADVARQVEEWNNFPSMGVQLEYPNWMKMQDNEIPSLCTDFEVVEIVWALRSHRTQYEEIKELKHMGPIYLKLVLLALLNWSVFLLFPVFELFFVNQNNAYPEQTRLALLHPAAPPPNLNASFLVGLMGTNFVLKFLISRQAIPCMVSVCGAPTVAGFRPSFQAYGIFMMVLSAISTTDLVTNTVFVIQQFKSTSVDSIKMLGVIPFRFALVLSWMVMLFQPMFGIAYSLPIASTWDNTQNRFFPFSYAMTPASCQSAVYQTLAEPTQTHQGAIMALAAVTRTQVLLWQAAGYLKAFHFGRSSGSVALKALRQQIMRSFIFVTLEAVVFLYLKACVVERQGCSDVVAIVSASTGMVSVTKTMIQDFSLINSLKSDVERGHRYFASLDATVDAERAVRQRVLGVFPEENHVLEIADQWVRRWKCFALLPAILVIVLSFSKIVQALISN